MDPFFCYLRFVCVFVVLSCLFLAALWSADLLGLLCVMFSCVLSLSHMLPWVRFGA